MKNIILAIAFLTIFTMSCSAQQTSTNNSYSEKYGKTLNLGVGLGYYGYIDHTVPFFTLNYEFDVVRNFTLAPFVGIYSYNSSYYWGDPGKPKGDPSYRKYSYRETAVPVGIKGTYYFDKLFRANAKWDFYAAGSLGFVYRRVSWENNYYGDRYAYTKSSPLYLDVHIGTEYHINNKVGLFLDLSTGVSTIGLAIH